MTVLELPRWQFGITIVVPFARSAATAGRVYHQLWQAGREVRV
jgi:hypothetical protein